MRVTIIVDDNVVLVQGHPNTVDCSALMTQNIHAVQWYDSWGEVEYAVDLASGNRPPNARISDFSPFQSFLDAWGNEANRPAVSAAAAE